jgi:hypothetical protein
MSDVADGGLAWERPRIADDGYLPDSAYGMAPADDGTFLKAWEMGLVDGLGAMFRARQIRRAK